jgi:hypothetical protein
MGGAIIFLMTLLDNEYLTASGCNELCFFLSNFKVQKRGKAEQKQKQKQKQGDWGWFLAETSSQKFESSSSTCHLSNSSSHG